MTSSIQYQHETQSETQVSSWPIFEKMTKSESSIHAAFPWKIAYDYQTYVCLVDNMMVKSSRNTNFRYDIHSITDSITEEMESEPALDRSEARHRLDLKDTHRKETEETSSTQTSSTDSETNTNVESDSAKPQTSKLARKKWLHDKNNGFPESSSSLSPSMSSSSSDFDSQESVEDTRDMSEKTLTTIINLDREYKMFGISDIFVVGSLGKTRKSGDEGPVFPQTAIVQVCLDCCKHKCGTCYSCATCTFPICPPHPAICGSCYSAQVKPLRPICKSSMRYLSECARDFGLTITVDKKPKIEPSYVEITPRSSCVLSKPLAARSCHHCPTCLPPSSCFPYLAPCFWPARPSAPCTTPARCFHNPPCLPQRQRKSPKDPHTACPKHGLCKDKPDQVPDLKCPNKYGTASKQGCSNPICPGKIPGFPEAIKSKYEMSEKYVDLINSEKDVVQKTSSIKSAIKRKSPE